MTRLQSAFARLAAGSLLVALVVAPPLLVAQLIGRPFPHWSTLANEVDTGQVSADTVMRVAALLFIAIWIWIVATIAAETYRLTAARRSPRNRPGRAIAVDPRRRTTFLHRLVRVAVLGAVTTAATVSSWPLPAGATSGRSLAGSIDPPTPVTAPADPVDEQPATPATTTLVANGRATPLSIAVDLGDETLRDDIIAMNRSTEWSGGVFPDGMVVTVPVVEQVTSEPAEAGGVGTYVVRTNDGMWNVAEALLGDGSRHHELRQLLHGQEVAPGVVFTADTEVIHPGWTFSYGDSPRVVDLATHVVEAGDTLSSIAERHLGDPDRWTEVWDANADRQMPDGRRFDDPNLIVPGWRLQVPTPDGDLDGGVADSVLESVPAPTPTLDRAPASAEIEPETEPAASAPAISTPTSASPVGAVPSDLDVPAAPPRQVTTTLHPAAAPATAVLDGDAGGDVAADHSIWTSAQRSVWPNVVAGSLLATGLAVTVGRLRNRRLSQLAAGSRIPDPSDRVAGTEHAIRTQAERSRIDTLSVLLRSFTPHAAHHQRPPAVRAVQLGSERIEVLLARPEPLTPRGWTTIDGGQSWTHRFDEPVDEHRQLLTPALVTIGARADQHPDEVLLDLETAGSLSIVGDRAAAIGLARSIVLELATYPLGVSMDVSLIGIDFAATEHCDRVWSDTSIDRAIVVARRRIASRDVSGQTVMAARAQLDEDDGTNDPHVFVIDASSLGSDDRTRLDELVELCAESCGAAVVVIGDRNTTERIVVDGAGAAQWSGVDLRAPGISDTAAEEVAVLLDQVSNAEPEVVVADDFMTGLLRADEACDAEQESYTPPQHDVLIQLMGEPRVHGIELSAEQTELLALLACLRHRTEIHMGLVHDSIAPDRARKTIENRMSKLRGVLGVGSDGHDLLPEAAPGRGGRSHYLVSPLVLTDIDLLEHRYFASQDLSSGDALNVLRDGLDLMRGPLFRARRGFDFWPHSEGVIVAATSVIQTYACRLIDLAAEADDAALVLRTTKTCGCVLDNPLAEFPIRQAEQAYAEASGNDELLASVERARRRLLEHIDTDDTFAEAG